MKKRLAVAAVALMFAGLGVSAAQAAPGPNGHNDHGICTAYFNGQKKGHEEGNGDEVGRLDGVQQGQRKHFQSVYRLALTRLVSSLRVDS